MEPKVVNITVVIQQRVNVMGVVLGDEFVIKIPGFTTQIFGIDQSIQGIKWIRDCTRCGLKEAKDIVDEIRGTGKFSPSYVASYGPPVSTYKS